MRTIGLVGTILALTLAPAAAQDETGTYSHWFFRLGAAELQNMNGSTNVRIGGLLVAGTDLHYKDAFTPLPEVGYKFTPDFSAVLALGIPTHVGIRGTGSLVSTGDLASASFAPILLTAQYQPFHDGVFRPFLGAGIADMVIFSAHAPALTNPKLTSDLSPEIEAGSEIMFQENVGMFLEVKKTWLAVHASGRLGGLALEGTANISPLLYAAGVSLHF